MHCLGARKLSSGLIIQELVGKLVSRLEKEKPSSINPYVFHLYDRFECLREGEMLEFAKMMLEFDVTLEVEVQPDPKTEDLDREPLNFAE